MNTGFMWWMKLTSKPTVCSQWEGFLATRSGPALTWRALRKWSSETKTTPASLFGRWGMSLVTALPTMQCMAGQSHLTHRALYSTKAAALILRLPTLLRQCTHGLIPTLKTMQCLSGPLKNGCRCRGKTAPLFYANMRMLWVIAWVALMNTGKRLRLILAFKVALFGTGLIKG